MPDPVSHAPLARLLVLPGWDDDGKSQYDELEAELAPQGWLCRRADLPDASWDAQRRDSVSREDNLHQALADHAALVGNAAPSPLAALGFSYGGYMAALIAGSLGVDWLVLRSPALYPDEDWTVPKAELDKREMAAYRRTLHRPADNKALAACAAFRGDVLLVESERDTVVPGQVSESYARAFAQARSLTRHTILGADHTLEQARWRREYHALAVRWLGERAARHA